MYIHNEHEKSTHIYMGIVLIYAIKKNRKEQFLIKMLNNIEINALLKYNLQEYFVIFFIHRYLFGEQYT